MTDSGCQIHDLLNHDAPSIGEDWSQDLLDALAEPEPVSAPDPGSPLVYLDAEESVIAEFRLLESADAGEPVPPRPPTMTNIRLPSLLPVPVRSRATRGQAPPVPYLLGVTYDRLPPLRPLPLRPRPTDGQPARPPMLPPVAHDLPLATAIDRPGAFALDLCVPGMRSVRATGVELATGCLVIAHSLAAGRILARSRTARANEMLRSLARCRKTYPDLVVICYRRRMADVDVARLQFQRLVWAGLLVKVPSAYLEYRLGEGVEIAQLQSAILAHITAGVDMLRPGVL